MSDRSLFFWVLSSFTGVLIIFIAVPMGLNDPAHVDHMMAQFFGYMGFAISIMSAFYGLWAIAIYEPNKIRIADLDIADLDIDLPDVEAVVVPDSSKDYHDYIDAMGLDDLSPLDRLMKIKSLIRQVSKDTETTDLDNTHDTYLKLADLLYEVDALYRSK